MSPSKTNDVAVQLADLESTVAVMAAALRDVASALIRVSDTVHKIEVGLGDGIRHLDRQINLNSVVNSPNPGFAPQIFSSGKPAVWGQGVASGPSLPNREVKKLQEAAEYFGNPRVDVDRQSRLAYFDKVLKHAEKLN